MIELLIRFLVGGAVVSFFATLGDVLRPRSFAGLFAAAPSVALATVGLTIHQQGAAWAATEGRFMLLGTAAFWLYAVLVGAVLRRSRMSALAVSVMLMPVWFGAALGLWFVAAGRL